MKLKTFIYFAILFFILTVSIEVFSQETNNIKLSYKLLR
jgi:hypothetical protein